MNLTMRMQNLRRALIQKYGSTMAKRRIWNREYVTGRWSCLDTTEDHRTKRLIEAHVRKGRILDLGCGSGTLALELPPVCHSGYIGIDISDVAVGMAGKRLSEAGRADRHEFYQSDILSYEPTGHFNVILYGDSLYYIPHAKIPGMIDRYAMFLAGDGVFIARLFDVSGNRKALLDLVQSHCEVLESHVDPQTHACHLVFRPSAVKN